MQMRVAMVSSYDAQYPGGVAEHMRSLSAALRRRGHEVTLFAPGPPVEREGYVRTGRTWTVPGNGSRAHVGLSLRLGRDTRRALSAAAFDVVHYHEPLLPTLPMLTMRLCRTAAVGTFHASSAGSPAYRCGRPLLMPLFRRLNVCIAVSEPARDFAMRYFAGEYRIIPNGVDTARFSPAVVPVAGLRSPPTVTILYVGRLDERKGLPTLLEAFAAVRRERADVRLVVVGDGPLRERCRRFVARGRVPDVIFAGFVDPAVLPGHFTAADLFCAPATGQESFGIVLLEAMASGLPVVASAIPGYSRIVEHGRTGILVPPRDPTAWAHAITRLVDDAAERRRLGRAGVADAARYDWERVAGEVLEAYALAVERFRRRVVAADLAPPDDRSDGSPPAAATPAS